MKVFKTSFWIAIILSVAYMGWTAIQNKGLVCGFLEKSPCGVSSWLAQLGVMFVIIFVVFIIIFGIITRRMTRFGYIRGKLGRDIEEKQKVHRELGAAEAHQLHMTKKLKKKKMIRI